ncbi:MAG: T9SS type A sorting domain-containing protein [Ignavibacteria bacterium]|nr:T9SS type A sorting domain-containing protein [Ignavibacteria bacterium]
MHWPMYAHDRYRTNQYGFIPPDEPVGIQPISNVVPEKFELHQNFPNPFNPSTTIRFDVCVSGNVSLKVYDVLGREVAVLADEYLRAGSYERVFVAEDLSSGVYSYISSNLRAGTENSRI